MKRNIYANVLLAVLGMALLLPADLMSQGPGRKKDMKTTVDESGGGLSISYKQERVELGK